MPVPAAPNLKFLCSAEAELERPSAVIGSKVIFNVLAGTVAGPKLNGKILRSGGDWLTVRADGSMALDVRATMETDDGELIYTYYSGRLVLPAEMHEMDSSQRHKVDPANYYFRTAPLYETASEKYAWLNHIQAISVGRITETGVAYETFQVL